MLFDSDGIGPVQTDFIVNGQGAGEVGQAFTEVRCDPGLMRPFYGRNGQKYVHMKTGRMIYNEDGVPVPEKKVVSVRNLIMNGMSLPVHNNTLGLRKDQWKMMDMAVIKAARERLRAWDDLRAANEFGGFDGMSKMILESETVNRPGRAQVDMDALSETSMGDDAAFGLGGLPLPITHCSWHTSSRMRSVARSGGETIIDTTRAEEAARRVAEAVEKTTIGTQTGITFGVAADYVNAPTVYGYITHPDRETKTNLTASATATGENILSEVLAMIAQLTDINYFGPYMLYVSSGYDAILDRDFKANSDKTTRQRLREIDQLNDVRRLDFLTGDVMILVQMTSNVARAVNGLDIVTVQWESKGGFQLNFKTMCIWVPQVRSDYNGKTGICHGTTS